MTKEQYQELLLDPLWDLKRKYILKRDRYTCRNCGCKGVKLHVHHTYYEGEKKPWQYPNESMLSLCESCHEAEHRNKPIEDFIRKSTPVKKSKRKTEKKKEQKVVKVKIPKKKTMKKRNRLEIKHLTEWVHNLKNAVAC